MSGIRHLHPVPPGSAHGLVAAVYEQARPEFGLLPPILLHSPNPELLAGMWCVLRETLLCGAMPRATKETVAAAVSRANRCPFCVDAHSIMLTAAAGGGAAQAIAAGRDQDLEPELAAVLAWATSGRSPAVPGMPGPLRPPFPPEHLAEMIGTVAAFEYVNRLAHAFLPGSVVPPAAGRFKGFVTRLAALPFVSRVRRQRQPGLSLRLVPEEGLPPAQPWARPSPAVAGAFARFIAAVDAAGRESLPAEVRALVAGRLAVWDGTDPGLGSAWLDEAATAVPAAERPAARLALLVAFASYRLDDEAIAAFRATQPGDRALLGAVAWAAFTTADRIAARLADGAARR